MLLDDIAMRGCASHSSRPEAERELYETAVDVLVHLHRQPPMDGLPKHGLDEWLTELQLFPDWYAPAVGLEEFDREGWDAAWRQVLGPVADDGLGPVTVLRDYHAENVMLVDGRGGIGRFGLLDFQDALAGHPAYDLVSVLEDASRDVPPELEREMIDRYLGQTGADERFERGYWALAAQRNTRILGVFCRLWKRDGKDRYKHSSRAVGSARRDLQSSSRARPSLVRPAYSATVRVLSGRKRRVTRKARAGTPSPASKQSARHGDGKGGGLGNERPLTGPGPRRGEVAGKR